jgi:hypothetical protein
LNSLNLNQDDQVREELMKTVIHDNHFIHVLIRLSTPSPATLPHQLLVHPGLLWDDILAAPVQHHDVRVDESMMMM